MPCSKVTNWMSKNPKNVTNETSLESLLAMIRIHCGMNSRALMNKPAVKSNSMVVRIVSPLSVWVAIVTSIVNIDR